ncbi:MAG: hypothetical protein IJK42_08555 [Prevotella sp.]|nr:hypothetical protein [Prevotella sp.]
MKKVLLSMLLFVVSTAAMAQSPKGKEVNERLFDARVSELVYRLKMTDEQKARFVPIYRRYSEEMVAAWGDHRKSATPTTSEEAAELAKRRMERQQRAQAIRIKYIDEFAKVLDTRQVRILYAVESQIQQKLKARMRRAKAYYANRKTKRHTK